MNEMNRKTHKQKAVIAKDIHTVNVLLTEQHTTPNNTSDIEASSQEVADEYAAGAAGLSAILGQIVAYFSGRVHVDDMDVLSFSLHHLFCHIDYLYHIALPELFNTPSAERSPLSELLQRQHLWSQLRTLKHSICRMEPLCNLLSDATNCILDAFDSTSVSTPATAYASAVDMPTGTEQDWLQSLDQERWEQALTTLTASLHSWQHNHNHLPSFAEHFAALASTVPTISQLDEAFNVLLDSAAAIFGDILPSFQALSTANDEAIATLLFDLMQQSDQLLVQFDKALEPLHALIDHFSLIAHR